MSTIYFNCFHEHSPSKPYQHWSQTCCERKQRLRDPSLPPLEKSMTSSLNMDENEARDMKTRLVVNVGLSQKGNEKLNMINGEISSLSLHSGHSFYYRLMAELLWSLLHRYETWALLTGKIIHVWISTCVQTLSPGHRSMEYRKRIQTLGGLFTCGYLTIDLQSVIKFDTT